MTILFVQVLSLPLIISFGIVWEVWVPPRRNTFVPHIDSLPALTADNIVGKENSCYGYNYDGEGEFDSKFWFRMARENS